MNVAINLISIADVLMCYTIFYMGAVFKSIFLAEALPWEVCDPAWADLTTCYVRVPDSTQLAPDHVTLVFFSNVTAEVHTRQSSAEQYFDRCSKSQFVKVFMCAKMC